MMSTTAADYKSSIIIRGHYNLKEITHVLKYSNSLLAKGLNSAIKLGIVFLK